MLRAGHSLLRLCPPYKSGNRLKVSRLMTHIC